MPKQPMDRQPSTKVKNRKSLRLISDFTLAERYNDMKRSKRKVGWTQEQEAELQELEQLVIENSTVYTLTSLGRKRYRTLLKEHPPTKEQIAAAKAENGDTQWNAETFPPALVWECLGGFQYCSFEDWMETWDEDLSDGETMALMMAALDINMGFQIGDMGNGSRQTRR